MENKPLTERERIDALVFRLGISIRQLAKIVDMNENTFYHITDNSRFGISERTASKSCSGIEFLFSGLFFNFFIGGGVYDDRSAKESGVHHFPSCLGVNCGPHW